MILKKCQICGAVSSEKDETCPVCGTSLADAAASSDIAPSTKYPSIGAVHTPIENIRAERRTQGILGLLIGIGMVATGILIIGILALIGFLILLFGLTIIATDISWMRGNTFYDQDEPIIHGKVPFRGLTYGLDADEEEEASTETPWGASSQTRDEKDE
jgi:hypothetical protein